MAWAWGRDLLFCLTNGRWEVWKPGPVLQNYSNSCSLFFRICCSNGIYIIYFTFNQHKDSLVVDLQVVPSWPHFFSMSCNYEYITCYEWSSHACIVHLSMFNSNFLLWLPGSALFPKLEASARPATTRQQWKHMGCVRNGVLTYCILFF